MKLRADIVLRELADLFVEKNTKYGDNWQAIGKMMVALFPNGIELKTEDDFVRFHFISWVLGKLSRFTHEDMTADESAKDGVVYMAMIEAFNRYIKERDSGAASNPEASPFCEPHTGQIGGEVNVIGPATVNVVGEVVINTYENAPKGEAVDMDFRTPPADFVPEAPGAFDALKGGDTEPEIEPAPAQENATKFEG